MSSSAYQPLPLLSVSRACSSRVLNSMRITAMTTIADASKIPSSDRTGLPSDSHTARLTSASPYAAASHIRSQLRRRMRVRVLVRSVSASTSSARRRNAQRKQARHAAAPTALAAYIAHITRSDTSGSSASAIAGTKHHADMPCGS